MTHPLARAAILVVSLLAACAVRAEDRVLTYTFESKIAGSTGVPHFVHSGELEEFDNPGSPKGKEIGNYKSIESDSDDHAGARATAPARRHAAFLIVFKPEKEVMEAVKTWKKLELHVSALGGAEGAESGASVQVEMYRGDKKSWFALGNDMPEGWLRHCEVPGPYDWAAKKDYLAFRLSTTTAEAPNVLTLDGARLALTLPGGADELTFTSLPGACRLTRPDEPGWEFGKPDGDMVIKLRKEGDKWVSIRVIRYSGSYRQKEGPSIDGDNAKAVAESDLKDLLELYKTRDKPEVAKTQFYGQKALEFKFMGEDKEDGSLVSIREVFLREKGCTYRISVQGTPAGAKEDRLLIEKTLKSFAFTD